jgi:alpha-galactosidase
MSHLPSFVRLENDLVSLIFDCQYATPELLYYGARLSAQTNSSMFTMLATRQEAKCSPAVEPRICLMPSYGEGFTGSPGLALIGGQQAWATGVKLKTVKQQGLSVVFECVDEHRDIALHFHITLHADTSLVSLSTTVLNQQKSGLIVNWCAAPTIPLSPKLHKLKTFEGRWSNEFQTQDMDLFMGSYLRENRRGKTSHDTFPGLIAFASNTHEQNGECIGFHLATSGNHSMRAELMADGRSYAQFGELLLPGEVTLVSQQSYQSPTLYMAWTDSGFSALSGQFHQYIRANIIKHSPKSKPRPVHYNTWEGIYFNHDEAVLKSLADKVASLGVERFVLDDGWFKGRRSDKAGLGDWTVDEKVYPQGLTPLIKHVTDLGMEFGIWFEPEMVNPDSDLYRAHPDWVLQSAHNQQVPFRHQYVLDLSHPEVSEYLFQSLAKVLNQHPQISYIKWDMNRDVNHQGNVHGQPSMHLQIKQLYTLLARVKGAYPNLEIESCCSGGARVDLGILPFTDRFWTSDSNDALDRLAIQKGFSFFFPAEVMGAHVGPRRCHITGRTVDMNMRAAVSMFGHMGIEMDPRELTELETTQLTRAIAIYKEHRQLIHSGNLVRQNDDGLNIKFGIVAQDQDTALFSYNSIKETPRTTPGRYYFHGLDANKQYKLSLLWPEQLKEYSPSVLSIINQQIFTGEVLMEFGMQLPVLDPQTSLIFKVQHI